MVNYLRSRRYFILFGLTLLCLLFLPVFARLSIDTVLKPTIAEHNLALVHSYGKILTDLEDLSQFPVFPESAYKKNAEFVLSKYIEFDGDEGTTLFYKKSQAIKKIQRLYLGWKQSPLIRQRLVNDPDLRKLDTRWMRELLKYDYWDFSDNRKVVSLFESLAHVNASTRLEIFNHMPIPSYGELRSWALLNFINSYRSGKPLDGMRVYRKTAELINSSGTLIGQVTAAAMLKDEYAIMSLFDVKGWEPRPIFAIESYVRVSWAWIGILKMPYFGEFPNQFISYIHPQYGICAGSRLASADYGLYVDFFQPQSFFESNFTSNVAVTSKLYKKIHENCRIESFSRFLSRSPASINPWSSYVIDEDINTKRHDIDYDFSIQDNWIYLPYVRRLVGMMYFANQNPLNYLLHYNGQKPKFLGVQEPSPSNF